MNDSLRGRISALGIGETLWADCQRHNAKKAAQQLLYSATPKKFVVGARASTGLVPITRVALDTLRKL